MKALELAERAVKAASGDGVEAFVQIERSGFARFASSTVHQPTLIDDTTLTLRVIRDGRVGTVSTNRVDDAGLREAARRAEDAAMHAQPDPAFPGLAPAAEIPEVEGWDEETAALTPEGLAERAWTAIGAAPELGMYGYVTSGVTELALAATTGLAATQTLTDATVLALAGDAERSGYADATAWRIGDLDPAAVARQAADTAARTRSPVELEPGTHRAVLSPWAFGELLSYFNVSSFGSLALQEGRSFLAGRLGEQVFDERLTIREDGRDPAGMPKAFDFEGVPKQPVTLVEKGVAREVVWDRRTAARDGRESTGHALPISAQAHGPIAFNLFVDPGTATLDELAELVGDGIYVTRLHYVNTVDGRESLYTGMTRDGTFLIEGGKVTRPLVNLRFTTSFGALAAGLLGLTRERTLANASDFYGERYPYASLVPAVATESFTIVGTGSPPGL